MRRLSVRLDGVNVPLDSLAEVLKKTADVLAEMEREITGGKQAIHWDVTDLRAGSAIVEFAPRVADIDAPYVADRVVDGFISSFDPSANPSFSFDFSPRIVKEFEAIRRLVNEDVRKIVYESKDDESGFEAAAEISFDEARPAPVVSVTSDVKPRTYIGSVEGTLETLVGRETYCNIFDRITGRRIRCDCSKQMLAELAEHAWERVVVLTGEICEGIDGNIKNVKVARYRILTEPGSVPKPSELLGLYAREGNG